MIVIVSAHAQTTPPPFSVCFEHGCASHVVVTLAPPEWRSVVELFANVGDAETERAKIAQAIGALEVVASKRVGAADRGGTGLVHAGQMDCIDESINSTTYLTLFTRAGLLRWHRAEERATRGWLILGWPHTTAVISEKATGQRFAVDSWFYDNGVAPAIVPLEEWRRGWKPKDPE